MQREEITNFKKWVVKRQRPDHLTEEEFADEFFGVAGDATVEDFVTRASGRAKGDARRGSHIDLAVFTCYEDIRVMVIDTSNILRNSTEKELLTKNSVVEACFPGECEKRRVVCAVLSRTPSQHFDLGVVRTSRGVKAVFEFGEDWDRALKLILEFIKSRSPETAGGRRERAWSKWVEPSESQGCECGETTCECEEIGAFF